VYWNPDNYSSEYGENANETDYAHPSYYQQETAQTPRSAQPVQPLEQPIETSPDYSFSSSYIEGYDAPEMAPYKGPSKIESYDAPKMVAYKGPSEIEGYTVDPGTEQREAAKRGTAEGSSKKRKGLVGLGGIGVTIAGLLLKFKAVLVLLLDFKWLAFAGKFGLASISALISVAAYSFIFGWPFAIGIVALLFIHEMGHALVMKLKGIPVGGMIFIPLLGAAVFMRQMPKNAKDEAEVGIAGPIAGALASMVCLWVAQTNHQEFLIFAPLAYFGFFINLFNLIPIVPFDGGRVLAAIDRRVWVVGFLGLLAFQIWQWINGTASIWLLFFIFMAASQLWARRSVPNTPAAQAYYAVPVGERIILGLIYFGLAAFLVLGMAISHNLILGLAQPR
jgi:Zn-dependent protease